MGLLTRITGATLSPDIQAKIDNVPELDNKVNLLQGFTGLAIESYATGDGTDETTKLQNALNAGAGGTVFFPYGSSYKITSLTIPDNTRIIAYGAKVYNKTTHQALLTLGNGVKVYGLEIEGIGNSSFNANGRGVVIKGAYNDALGVIDYKSDIILEDCNIHNFGGYGIYTEYANYVKVRNCNIENIGYAGIQGLSCKNIHVSNKTKIKGISPGRASSVSGETICYNATFTLSTSGINTTTDTIDLNKYPRSSDCSVTNCTIEDNTSWEGLDTHGGENIVFKDNTIRNVKVPIAVVPVEVSITGDSKRYLAPQYCKVVGNTIYGLGNERGIVLSGAISNTFSTADASEPREYAIGCVIEGNTLYNCGESNNDNSGAIVIRETSGTSISGNDLDESNVIGINVYQTNLGFSITGNTIRDVQDSTYTAPACIAIRGSYNQGSINGNNLLRVKATLNTYVSVRGIWLATGTGNLIALGVNAITTTQNINVSAANHSALHYGNLGGTTTRLYSHSGNPDTVRSAAAGSLAVNIAGSEGSSLYVKETGYSTTGWRGVQTINPNTTANRPVSPPIGYQFFDTTLGKPIWYKGTGWVDSSGATV